MDRGEGRVEDVHRAGVEVGGVQERPVRGGGQRQALVVGIRGGDARFGHGGGRHRRVPPGDPTGLGGEQEHGRGALGAVGDREPAGRVEHLAGRCPTGDRHDERLDGERRAAHVTLVDAGAVVAVVRHPHRGGGAGGHPPGVDQVGVGLLRGSRDVGHQVRAPVVVLGLPVRTVGSRRRGGHQDERRCRHCGARHASPPSGSRPWSLVCRTAHEARVIHGVPPHNERPPTVSTAIASYAPPCLTGSGELDRDLGGEALQGVEVERGPQGQDDPVGAGVDVAARAGR